MRVYQAVFLFPAYNYHNDIEPPEAVDAPY